jgi:hypothetical protein
MKARTAATLITDHKRKIVAACIPDLHVTDGINYTTELHATPRMRPVLKGLISESEKASALTSLGAGALSTTLHSRDRWSQRNLRLKETNQGYPTVDIWGWESAFLRFQPDLDQVPDGVCPSKFFVARRGDPSIDRRKLGGHAKRRR